MNVSRFLAWHASLASHDYFLWEIVVASETNGTPAS